MKKDIHPTSRLVVFHDLASDHYIIARSTIATEETVTIDGTEYPIVHIEVSSASHPFYTGKQRVVDSTGRVDRFKQLAKRAAEAQKKAAKKSAKKSAATKKDLAKKTLSDLADIAS